MSKKIEDLFKDTFDGFEQQPKSDLWDKIMQQRQVNMLTNPSNPEQTPEHIYSKEFRNFESQPSEKIWTHVLLHINHRRKQKKYSRLILLLLLFVGSCSSLLWWYQQKGQDPAMGILQEELKKPIPATSEHQRPTQTQSQQGESPQTSTSEGNEYDASPTTAQSFSGTASDNNSPTYNTHPTAGTPTVSHTTSSPTIPESTNSVSSFSTTSLSGMSNGKVGEDLNDQIRMGNDLQKNDENQLAQNTAPQNINSASTAPLTKDTAAADKAQADQKTKPQDANKKWWRGPNYFMYTSETDMNNEESDWKFGASTGYEFPRLRFVGSSNDPLYVQFRKDDERRAPSFNVQAFASRQINRFSMIQTGIGFISYGFQGDYHHSLYTIQDSTTPQGNIIRDTIYSYRINSQSNYRINYLEIPILLGVNVGEYRLNATIKAGAILQMRKSQNGYALSPTSHQLEPIGVNNQVSANALGGSLYFSLGANYQIKHELSWFIESSYRYNINALMGYHDLKQYVNSIGLNTGFKFHID